MAVLTAHSCLAHVIRIENGGYNRGGFGRQPLISSFPRVLHVDYQVSADLIFF